MKHLVIYCHPNPDSFCNAILAAVTGTLKANGHEVKVRDLYSQGFDPVLKGNDFEALQAGKNLPDVKAEQEHIAWAAVITVIYPVWWTGLPAMLKGYIDRVFSMGFAYSLGTEGPVGLLEGKKVVLFSTQGQLKETYDQTGMTDAMKKTADTGIFAFCGMDVLMHKFFGAVPVTDDATRQGYIQDVTEMMGRF